MIFIGRQTIELWSIKIDFAHVSLSEGISVTPLTRFSKEKSRYHLNTCVELINFTKLLWQDKVFDWNKANLCLSRDLQSHELAGLLLIDLKLSAMTQTNPAEKSLEPCFTCLTMNFDLISETRANWNEEAAARIISSSRYRHTSRSSFLFEERNYHAINAEFL